MASKSGAVDQKKEDVKQFQERFNKQEYRDGALLVQMHEEVGMKDVVALARTLPGFSHYGDYIAGFRILRFDTSIQKEAAAAAVKKFMPDLEVGAFVNTSDGFDVARYAQDGKILTNDKLFTMGEAEVSHVQEDQEEQFGPDYEESPEAQTERDAQDKSDNVTRRPVLPQRSPGKK